ncbi:MAG: hypothetical protein F6J97_22635 [Leptolyngbya sp. SIO4C1]|nr:hypothetical protein [Leptolyngbya sp. SIO4C1]
MLIGVLAFLAYSAALLYKEDFAAYDNSQLTFYSLSGRSFGMPIWKESGRFFPLGLQEYNLIGLFSKSVFAYHSLSLLQLAVIGVCVFLLLDTGVPIKITTLSLALLSPSFIISFSGLIYPERNIIFWVSLLLIAIKRFSQNQRFVWFVIAVISAQSCLYYKETMFLLVGGIAAARILISIIKPSAQPDRPETDGRNILQRYPIEVAMLLLSAVFLLLYTVEILPNVDPSAIARGDKRVSFLQAASAYAATHYLLDAFVVVFLARLGYAAVRNRQHLNLFWDSAATGTFLYAMSYLKLGMVSAYYMAPANFLACLYLGYLLSRFLADRSTGRRSLKLAAAAIAVAMLLHQALGQSAGYLLERKNMIAGKAALYSFLENRYAHQGSAPETLFFQHPSSGFRLMEFSSFLEYKGLNILDDDRQQIPETAFLVTSKTQFEADLCVPYGRPYKCFYSQQPDSGDLIVILPEDPISKAELETVAAASRLVFRYQPKLNLFEQAIAHFTDVPDSELWLDAYVFEKR